MEWYTIYLANMMMYSFVLLSYAICICAFILYLFVYDRFRKNPEVKLYIIGSVRNKGDEEILKGCQQLVQSLHESVEYSNELRAEINIIQRIEFKVNMIYNEMMSILHETAAIGIHTMWNEHFGISVVEMMAGGLITIGHNSGGPKLDIITHPICASTQFNNVTNNINNSDIINESLEYNGFLASTVEEYVICLTIALDIYFDTYDTILKDIDASKTSKKNKWINTYNIPITYVDLIQNAKTSINNRFSDDSFKQSMCDALYPYFK